MLSYWLACTQMQKKQQKKKAKQTKKKTDSFWDLSLNVRLISRYVHHRMFWIYHFSTTTAELKTWVCFSCVTACLQCYEAITEGLIGSKGHILPPFSFTWAVNHSPWMCRQKMVHSTASKSPCSPGLHQTCSQKSREGLVSFTRCILYYKQWRTGWRLVTNAS